MNLTIFRRSGLCLASLILLSSQASAAVLLSDSFDHGNIATGGPGNVNGGFGTASNNNPHSASATETTGNLAVLNLATNSDGQNFGIVSTSTLDLASVQGFTATFVVAQVIGTPSGNGINLGISDTNAIYALPVEDGGNDNFRIHFGANGGAVRLIARTGASQPVQTTTTISSSYTLSELQDGFTASFSILNDNTFSYSISGMTLDNNTGSGSLQGGITYANHFDSADRVFAMVQRAHDSNNVQMHIDSISVVAIPEPSSALLLIGALGFLGFRRVRR